MDRKPQEISEVEQLIRQADSARAQLHSDVAALRHKLDVPARLRSSLQESPGSWLAGSLVSGLAASLLFRRKPRKAKKHGRFSTGVLGLTLTAARPLLKVWLADQAKHWLAEQIKRSVATRLNTHPDDPGKPLL